ncbi:hypothetical protein FOZ63_017573, partial [Perkinsus olseni]
RIDIGTYPQRAGALGASSLYSDGGTLLDQVLEEAATRAPSVPAPRVRMNKEGLTKIDIPNQGRRFQGRGSLDYPVSKFLQDFAMTAKFHDLCEESMWSLLLLWLSPAVGSELMSYMALTGAAVDSAAKRLSLAQEYLLREFACTDDPDLFRRHLKAAKQERTENIGSYVTRLSSMNASARAIGAGVTMSEMRDVFVCGLLPPYQRMAKGAFSHLRDINDLANALSSYEIENAPTVGSVVKDVKDNVKSVADENS